MAYADYSKLKALIVDDFDSFRMTVSKMLQEMGVNQIDTAGNGADALKMCRQKAYDFILCDHNLGKGKTGQQVLEALRHDNILSPVAVFILISAESSRSIVMAAYDYEPDEYLAKPVTTRSLQRRLDRLMIKRVKLTPVYQAINAGQLDVAKALCLKEIQSDGRFATRCQKILAELLCQEGELAEAEKLYREVLEHRPLDWAMLGMAQVKRAQGELLSAHQWLEETLQEHPFFMKAYDLRADIYRQQGAPDRLQQVLEEAVEVSPLAIQRQKRLADTALENNDVMTAASAYRKAVRLGENSVYDRPETHMNLARTTASLFQEDRQQAKAMARDALKALGEFENRFGKSPAQKLEAQLVEAQIFAGQGDQRKAEVILSETRTQMTEESVVLGLDASIELVKALRVLGEREQASRVLDELIQTYGDSEADLEKLDRLLEEPMSAKNRELVADINQRGISFYEEKHYTPAIESFDEALRKFPRHIGVRLNLAQALIDKMDAGEANEPDLIKLRETLAFVAETITPQHEQFRRFRQLQDLEKQCERKLASLQ